MSEILAAHQPNVFVVDDDPAILDSLEMLLGAHGATVTLFSSGDNFLHEDISALQGCVLLDVRMPGKDGLTVLTQALGRNPNLQVVMMSGHGDIPMAVKALSLGALDFIEKPFTPSQMLKAMERACSRSNAIASNASAHVKAKNIIDKLTPRELAITQKLVDGKPNKIIAFELGISIRTVETHRANIVKKTGVNSLADLVKLYLAATS